MEMQQYHESVPINLLQHLYLQKLQWVHAKIILWIKYPWVPKVARAHPPRTGGTPTKDREALLKSPNQDNEDSLATGHGLWQQK